jgi:hypothetical protein
MNGQDLSNKLKKSTIEYRVLENLAKLRFRHTKINQEHFENKNKRFNFLFEGETDW